MADHEIDIALNDEIENDIYYETNDEEEKLKSDIDDYSDSDKYSEDAQRIARNAYLQMKCKQSEMKYKPLWVKIVYFTIALICISLGFLTKYLSESIKHEETIKYNTIDECNIGSFSKNAKWGKQCVIQHKFNNNFESPIYMHYKINNFFQNQLTYLQSRSFKQEQNIDVLDVRNCRNLQYGQNSLKMLPCGLIAYSFFNDKFKGKLIRKNGVIIDLCPHCDNTSHAGVEWDTQIWRADNTWDDNNIVWKSDKESSFKATKQISGLTTNIGNLQLMQNTTLPNTNNNDFIVWMRTATTPIVTKLHRIINIPGGIQKGDVMNITIANYFEVESFGGEKSLIFTTNGVMGGKNDVLSISFMVMGFVSMFVLIVFWVCIANEPKNNVEVVEMHLTSSTEYNS